MRSKAEEELAEYLTGLGVGFTYESEKWKYEKPVRGALCKSCGEKKIVKIATYTPDFIITKNGVAIEYKGRLTSADRAKYVAVKRGNPDRKLVFIFGADNYLHTGPTVGGVRRNTERYSDWAKAEGFDWAIRGPKSEWFL